MYDRNATEKAGLHDLPGAAEFEVYRGSDYPDLGLSEGWYWDIPECRVDCPTTPRIDGRYAYANGPYPTSGEAYAAAMHNDGDALN